MKRRILLLSFVIAIALVSCKKDDNPKPEVFSVGKGVFVLNEGTFTFANSSLSFYDFEKNAVENNLFYRVNNAPIGDVGQSLTLIGNDLYIVVNNSKYIYKVDSKTIAYKAKIEGFTSPRYMLPVSNDKAYVSDLERKGLWVLNLNTMEKNFLETGNTTEAMVKIGDEVFVANWSNYYPMQMGDTTSNKTIQVIDCVNDDLVTEIEVAQEPNSMVVDKYNHIWVSCSGSYNAVMDPALICIDPATYSIIKRFDFTPYVDYPSGIAIDGAGENIFFMNGGYSTLDVYKMSVDATELPETPFIQSEGRWFYNLKINPQNDDIYVTMIPQVPTQNGSLLRYTSNGILVGTYEVGLFPSYMLFN